MKIIYIYMNVCSSFFSNVDFQNMSLAFFQYNDPLVSVQCHPLV